MMIFTRLAQKFSGDDSKMRRLVTYWFSTVLLYVLCLGVLWVEVISGAAQAKPVLWLTGLAITGHAVFYLLIRLSKLLFLTPAQLSVFQGRFAIMVTVAGYTMMGPLRGATLIVLLVILVFCAFTLEARKTHSLSVFAIVLLGTAMIWMGQTNSQTFDAKTEVMHFILIGTMLVVVGFLTGRLSDLRSSLKTQKAELATALERIQMLATRDALTALTNRRHMADLLELEERKRQANSKGSGETNHTSTCLALLDIDWFKKINDTHGHAAGDEVLRMFAQEGMLTLRSKDVLARWGGEEFLLLLPDTQLRDAAVVLDRLKKRIQSLRFHFNGASIGVTFSAGLVELMQSETFSCGISRADVLLYRAKAEGRDRIIGHDARNAAV